MGIAKTDEEILDNPVWHALRTRLAAFAESDVSGRALRFHREVAFFAGVEAVDEAAWEALAALVGREGYAMLFRDEVPHPPAGWEEVFRGPTWQLVAADLVAVPDVPLVELGLDDAEEMLALTQLTEPGPFFARTHELGTYVGVRREGRLVAMAGQRFRVPGWIEISAVCTHPEAQREGLAAALTLHLVRRIREEGDEAFLHVLETNESALRLYLALGFEIRRQVDVVAAQWAGT
jgi:ribosomal protein S18 acetylase RimI-like enzyme